jgi:hypothetical protein
MKMVWGFRHARDAGDSVSRSVAAVLGWDGTRLEVGSGRVGGEGIRGGEVTPG